MAKGTNRNVLIHFITTHPIVSSKDIAAGLQQSMAIATIKRGLQKLIADHLITVTGKGKATRYQISPTYELLRTIDVAEYFTKEIDDRIIKKDFNHVLMPEVLAKSRIFTNDEDEKLQQLQSTYLEKSQQLTPFEYNKELERLGIDLSWKSSQIEGNTYSLLETERLLKEKQPASGKPKDDATMLLNHKDAIEFIIEQTGYVSPLRVQAIEFIERKS